MTRKWFKEKNEFNNADREVQETRQYLINLKNQIETSHDLTIKKSLLYTAFNTSNEKIPENPNVDFYVIPINTQKESLLVARLRNQGYKVEHELGNKKIGKALDKANKEKIRNVIIIDEDEVKNNQFKIKDMFSGEERNEFFSLVNDI